MTFFKSFWTKPTLAAKKSRKWAYNSNDWQNNRHSSKRTEHLIIKKSPAVTNVAAWIKAETLPSHQEVIYVTQFSVDLPNAPQKMKKVMILKRSALKDKKEN